MDGKLTALMSKYSNHPFSKGEERVKGSRIRLLIILILILLITVCLGAQTGDIIGVLIDKETQAPLTGVNVVISGTDWGAATDLDGRYHIRNIPVGTYNLTFQMMGYEKLEKLNIPVSPDRISQMDVSLGISSIAG